MTRILAIETSCDETAAAVVEDGQRICSNVVASQIDIHRRYGGIFPEIASRQHILAMTPVVEEALAQAHATWNDLDAVAVTYGPGLAGSLLVGVNTAKGIALGRGLPLIGVNHLEGHVYAHWLQIEGDGVPKEELTFPLLILIVSGGHSELFLMRDHLTYERLGQTVDDAAGEAFDKVARLLGLGYPGGPVIEKKAAQGNPAAYRFAKPKLEGEYDFSFSGIKTAVLREVQRIATIGPKGELPPGVPVADLAASFQAAVVEQLCSQTLKAAEATGATAILMGGGVSANQALRTAMKA